MGPARALLLTLRPHQWVKNLFVAAPLVFAKRLDDPAAALAAAGAVASFCALSSAVYALNDVLDVDKDRAHPVKKHRPIASGALSPRTAIVAAAALATLALALACVLAPWFGVVAGSYLGLNVVYSLKLKHIAYLDVGSIAAGFVLRVLGGAFAVGVPASPWLLACTALLAAFMGFGKRTHELAQSSRNGDAVGRTRAVLEQYRPDQLRVALYSLATLTTLAYVFYTLDGHTIRFFGGRHLAWTVPFCALGIGRFLWLVTRHPRGDSPTEAILRDVPFMANLAIWGLVVLAIIYAS